MDRVINHAKPAAENTEDVQERRSNLVYRMGDRSSGLFQGWGPKL